MSERLFASNAPKAPKSARGSRVVSTSGDLSRFGGDVVHEEPDELEHDANSMQRLSLEPQRQTDGHADADYRPPLPVRRTSEQKVDTGQKSKEI